MSVENQIFICYAKEDQKIALQLYYDLQDTEITPWIDCKNILPGQNWKFMIEQAIRESAYFLILLSANSINKRGYVQKEMKEALDT